MGVEQEHFLFSGPERAQRVQQVIEFAASDDDRLRPRFWVNSLPIEFDHERSEPAFGSTAIGDLVVSDPVEPGKSVFAFGHLVHLPPSYSEHFGDNIIDIVDRNSPQAVAVHRSEVSVECSTELRI